ncbi:MAG: quinolinate synthase NadA [Phycisphaerales bacterium JB054]
MLWQPSLDDYYTRMPADEAARLITERREQLGESLVILGHHYQTDEVIRHADFTGDSLKLSQLAASVSSERAVEHVMFCGVHFMAETADMLTPEHVKVILPDLSAGCSMADMADYDDTVEAWNLLHESLKSQGWAGRIIPITYVNSTAAIKAFVGQHGGACCTSSNADTVFDWAMRGGEQPDNGDEIKILFLPDQHLGRNTAAKYGIDTDAATCVYDPRRTRQGEPLGGATAEQLLGASVVLWAGHCSVHKLFRPEHCAQIREANRQTAGDEPTRIIVHPECAKEVVDLADDSGSTEYILRTVRESPRGSRWAVGTEVHLVNRLAAEMAPRGVHVRILSDCQCLCTTMYRIDQPHMLWILDNLCGIRIKDGESETGKPRALNVISVHPEVRSLALKALDRMLSLSQRPSTTEVD